MPELNSRPFRRAARMALLMLLAAGVFGAEGCGYALAGRGSFLPADIKTIGVPEFANRSNIFNLETLLTQKVRSEFIGRGKYQIVPETTNVDAVLTGEIIAARPDVSSLNTQQLAARYSVTIVARVELRDVRENKVLWENPAVTFREEYEAQSGQSATDPNAFFSQDVNALDRLTSDFARTIVSAILEAF